MYKGVKWCNVLWKCVEYVLTQLMVHSEPFFPFGSMVSVLFEYVRTVILMSTTVRAAKIKIEQKIKFSVDTDGRRGSVWAIDRIYHKMSNPKIRTLALPSVRVADAHDESMCLQPSQVQVYVPTEIIIFCWFSIFWIRAS